MSDPNPNLPTQLNGSPAAAPAQPPEPDTVLSVRGISKCYHIYSKPRDRLKQVFARGLGKSLFHPFWALRAVSFDVRRGEAVGIVGCNGSGKSTLLQIIAGTLRPTEGEVHVRGRVAALLELGSGFNPEFTGRDNIFLNGAILGIPRKEMEKRFDDIAAFADIGEFIDQPVKTYSSGMHARLAFSVAISVDPDILILDEILAVGDMGFQQKCVARMRQLLDSGVTLLFVSHAPDAVKSLCQKGLFLVNGQPAYFGSSEEAVNHYIAHVRQISNEEAQRQQAALSCPVEFKTKVPGALRYGSGHAQIEQVRMLDGDGQPVRLYQFGERIVVEVSLRAVSPLPLVDVSFGVRDAAGIDLMGSGTSAESTPLPSLAAGEQAKVSFSFDNCLRQGIYGVWITLTLMPNRAGDAGMTLDHLDGVVAFEVIADPRRWVMNKFHQPVQVRIETLAPAGAGSS
jgi:lipopolysaccharide transport system ATP-binding protein